MTRPLTLLSLLASTAAMADTPAYLPRAAWLGLYSRGAITPHLQLSWEPLIVEGKRDQLVGIFAGGLGQGISLPTLGTHRMTFFYQHMLGGGLGYRMNVENGLHWGFHAVVGPWFYGARFDGLRKENHVIGAVEGRVQLGWRMADGFRMGLAVGVMEPLQLPLVSNAAPFVGGLNVSLMANWR